MIRNPKMFLKKPKDIPKVVREVITSPPKPGQALSLLKQINEIKIKATNPYDELWLLRGLLSEKITESFSDSECNNGFAIEFIKKKILIKQKELNIPGAGAL